MSKGGSITMFSGASGTPRDNIAAKESWGYKRRENLFVSSFVGSSSGGVSYISYKTRSTNDQQGKIVNTGVLSDIGIVGNGYLTVANDVSGEVRFTRRGDFRQDDLGYWKNGADQLLKAWKLDDKGGMPQNSSLLSSLDAVNFANTKGLPVATTVVSIAMNLDAAQEALRGNGIEALISRGGLNTGTNSGDILLPDQTVNAQLLLGDKFRFTSTTSNIERAITYGGMAISRAPGGNGAEIFGAAGANDAFTFSVATGLTEGAKLRITLTNGKSYTFSATQGAANPNNKTFNSITGLVNAINNVSSLKARIDSTGKMYIAPLDANLGINFTNIGGTIKEGLGLTDLAAAIPNEQRFNSLESLRDAVNKDQATYSLKATLLEGGIKITSLLSTADFNVVAESKGIRAITNAIINPAATEKGRATVFINAPAHGLQAGDFVKLSGIGNPQLPDAIYAVNTVSSGGFTVSLINNDPATFPVVASTAFTPPNASWQKIGGQVFDTQNGNITAAGGPNITITAVGHGLANNDLIYVTGGTFNVGGNDVILPDGYYRVQNVAANTFEVTPTNIAGGGTYVGDTVSFRKIGTTSGAVGDTNNSFDTVLFSSDAGAGSKELTYYIGSNHTYNVDDVIKFADLAGPTMIDGITIDNNISYKITAFNKAAGTVRFAVEDAGTATAGNGTVNILYSAAQATVDSGSQLLEYFNIDQTKTLYTKTYDPTDIDKNLSAAASGAANFASNLTYSVPITIYDSLGNDYTLLLYFAKLNNNQWAVELVAQKDNTGAFEVTNLAAENGLIRSGIINFTNEGKLIGIPDGFDSEVEVQRNNGSAPTRLTIDWENILSDIKTGTVTQNKNPNNVEIIQQNGQPVGTLVKTEITDTGFIVGTFDSGESRALYKLPVATFSNFNGLEPGLNDTSQATYDSGALLLKESGQGGAGKTLGGVLEASNVDVTEELLNVQELGNTIRANARVAATNNENFKTILNELRG